MDINPIAFLLLLIVGSMLIGSRDLSNKAGFFISHLFFYSQLNDNFLKPER